MQKTLKNLTLSVLGCLALLLSLNGCSTPQPVTPPPTVVNQVTKPKPIIPQPDQLIIRPVHWFIVTPQNATTLFANQNTKTPALIALTPSDFKKLQLNTSDTIVVLGQYKDIVKTYDKYFKQN